MNTSIARSRLAAVALATTLVAACVSQPVPLQGQFTPITPRQAADHDSTRRDGSLGWPHRRRRTR